MSPRRLKAGMIVQTGAPLSHLRECSACPTYFSESGERPPPACVPIAVFASADIDVTAVLLEVPIWDKSFTWLPSRITGARTPSVIFDLPHVQEIYATAEKPRSRGEGEISESIRHAREKFPTSAVTSRRC